jgi:hypothetical protein
MYITDEELAALPEDAEEAFITLERIVRTRYQEAWDRLGEHDSPLGIQRRYMSVVLPAAKHYRIAALSRWERPDDSDDCCQTYDRFIADVDYSISDLRLRSAERLRQHSVELDEATKIKLRHLLAQVREVVDKLDISVAKKDRLYGRINALQKEIDRERTRYQTFADLLIEAADDAGEAATRLEPVVRLIERVGAALGVAKRGEEAKPKLPPRQDRKRIEPPKRPFISPKNGGRGFDKAIDDEIPF